jgi:hypothetical protein
MIRRSTWIFLAVFVALLVFAWYYRNNKEVFAPKTTPTAVSQSLFDFPQTALTSLEVKSADGRQTRLEKDAGGTWTLVEPLASIDLSKAEPAFNQLTGLRVMTSLESPPGLDVVGLSPARYVITVGAQDGKTYVLLVGMETPTQTGYYVQLDNGAVQVVAKFSLDSILSLVDEPPILATPTPEVTATSPISGTQEIPGTSTP